VAKRLGDAIVRMLARQDQDVAVQAEFLGVIRRALMAQLPCSPVVGWSGASPSQGPDECVCT
jgi:hypothetical protein